MKKLIKQNLRPLVNICYQLHKGKGKGFSRWLNVILKAGDAIANNIIYTIILLGKCKEESLSKEWTREKYFHSLSETKHTRWSQVRHPRDTDHPYLNKNIVNELYNKIHIKNSEHPKTVKDYKKKLKDLHAVFVSSKQKNKPN